MNHTLQQTRINPFPVNPEFDKLPTISNLAQAELIEIAVKNSEGKLADEGELCVFTGKHTGRSPNDKYFVQNEATTNKPINWAVNEPISQAKYDELRSILLDYISKKTIYMMDLQVCADPKFRVNIKLFTESAWSAAFANNLFIRPTDKSIIPTNQITILHCPNFTANHENLGTRSGTIIALDLATKTILICGSAYAGEIKKSVFTMLNFLMPDQNILPMHCSANESADGATALFFGLSGTGKTTLSNDSGFQLIGDDEHGWSENGVFNFEGGCYAKTIRLSEESEPQIWNATRRFGTIIENVPFLENTRKPDFDSDIVTENTRSAYTLIGLDDIKKSGTGQPPKNIFFLSADAFGVLPPISKLEQDQIRYYFLLGYTAKLAGTEIGIKKPQATFSSCFGAPFLPLIPEIYADMLLEKVQQYNANVWLVNTGWSGGKYGVGKRMALTHTRALIRTALLGGFEDVSFVKDPYFGLNIPVKCPGVPDTLLNPALSWSDSNSYAQEAEALKALFAKEYLQFNSTDSE